MEDAITLAQSYGLPEGDNHRPRGPGGHTKMVANWRQAIVQQMLTPAPDTRAIAWKRAALAAGDHEHTDIKTERIERAIADDVACLAAHPIRRSNCEAMARRREFNEAMRRRVREVAAFRGLSDEEIKPTLTLKHHEIAKFTEQHGVRPEWLFEGEGRVFKNDPVTLTGEPQP